MRRWMAWLVSLVLIYALELGSFAGWDLFEGAIISLALLFAFRRFVFAGELVAQSHLLKRMLALVPFVGVVLLDVLRGARDVAMIVLRLRPPPRPGIITIPIDERTMYGVTASVLAISFSPGSVLVDVDWKRRVMLFHFIDASDPERIRRTYREIYRRYQRSVWP